MSTRKVLLGAGALLLTALVIATAVYLSPHTRTIDFRGYVKEIYFDDTNDGTTKVAVIYASDVFDSNSTYTIYAEYDIRVTDLNGDTMTLDEIKTGDMIDLDYKRKTGKNGERYAKWISVCPHEVAP